MTTVNDIIPSGAVIPCSDCSGTIEVVEVVGMTIDGEPKAKVRCDTCFNETIATVMVDKANAPNHYELYGHRVQFSDEDGLALCRHCSIGERLDEDAPLFIRNIYRIGLMKKYECGKIEDEPESEVGVLKRIKNKITVGE